LAFGVYPAVSIADARLQRDKARKLLANGIDPGAAQKADRRAISAKAENQRPKHPGAVLRETVIPGLAVAPERMAELLGVSANVLMQVLGEHQAVNCTIAVGLENLLGTSAESWMQMQLEVDLWDARQELNRFAQFGRTLSIKDLAAMPNDSHVETDFLLPAATNAAHLAAAIAQHTAGIAERHELAGMQTLPLVPNGTQ
jgi:addiction module HigA family antidote